MIDLFMACLTWDVINYLLKRKGKKNLRCDLWSLLIRPIRLLGNLSNWSLPYNKNWGLLLLLLLLYVAPLLSRVFSFLDIWLTYLSHIFLILNLLHFNGSSNLYIWGKKRVVFNLFTFFL